MDFCIPPSLPPSLPLVPVSCTARTDIPFQLPITWVRRRRARRATLTRSNILVQWLFPPGRGGGLFTQHGDPWPCRDAELADLILSRRPDQLVPRSIPVCEFGLGGSTGGFPGGDGRENATSKASIPFRTICATASAEQAAAHVRLLLLDVGSLDERLRQPQRPTRHAMAALL